MKLNLDRYVPGLLLWLSNKMASSASSLYRTHFDLGVADWRVLSYFEIHSWSTASSACDLMGLDKAAVSRSVALLQERGFLKSRPLGLRKIEIVERIPEIQHGISATRDFLSSCWIDEVGCKEGIVHLDSYKKKWNNVLQCWMDEPLHDIHSEAADSFRQAAQTFVNNSSGVRPGARPKRRNRSGMAA